LHAATEKQGVIRNEERVNTFLREAPESQVDIRTGVRPDHLDGHSNVRSRCPDISNFGLFTAGTAKYGKARGFWQQFAQQAEPFGP
jgi:hypothetical protein